MPDRVVWFALGAALGVAAGASAVIVWRRFGGTTATVGTTAGVGGGAAQALPNGHNGRFVISDGEGNERVVTIEPVMGNGG